MTYIEQHIKDHCKTAEDVRQAAIRAQQFRNSSRPKKVIPRHPLYVLIEQACLIPRQPDPPLIEFVHKPNDIVDNQKLPITIKEIQKEVSHRFSTPIMDILSVRRHRDVVLARQIVFVLCRLLTPKSYPEIGRRTGDRDHTTVLHAVNKYKWLSIALTLELSLDDSLTQWVDRAFFLCSKKSPVESA